MEDVGGNVGEVSGLYAILDEPFIDFTPTHSSIVELLSYHINLICSTNMLYYSVIKFLSKFEVPI